MSSILGFSNQHVHVKCENLCPTGYSGYRCERKCPYPHFGFQCEGRCDCSLQFCHYINGCPHRGKSKNVYNLT